MLKQAIKKCLLLCWTCMVIMMFCGAINTINQCNTNITAQTNIISAFNG